jgi:hypothetical protein
MKPNKTRTKVTYTQSTVGQLLLKEAFQRDLTLFKELLQKETSLFGTPLLPKGSTFTVITEADGSRQLCVNIPLK